MVNWRALAHAIICLPAATALTLASTSVLAAQNESGSAAPSSAASSDSSPSNGVSIAVADFTGGDKELGRFLADTLLTDLAQSERLRMVERAEIGKALTELKLQSTGLAEPQDVKKVGRLLGADRLIVGSYLVRDNQLVINARLLDVRTGRVTPGGGANVTGNRDSVLRLVHQLAHRFYKNVTGEELLLENERVSPVSPPSAPSLNRTDRADRSGKLVPMGGDPADMGGNGSQNESRTPDRSGGGYNVSQPDSATDTVSPQTPNSSNTANAFNNANTGARTYQTYYPGYTVNPPPVFSLPANVQSPMRSVTDGDLTRVLSQGGGRNVSFFTSGPAFTPVSRVRALVALLKASGLAAPVAVSPAVLAGVIPDAQTVPAWAAGYLHMAVRQGIWPANRILHPDETATWGFLSAIVSRVNSVNQAARLHPAQRLVPAIVVHARDVVSRSNQGVKSRRLYTKIANVVEAEVIIASLPPRPSFAGSQSDGEAVQGAYTGLLIEARDLPVQRSMGARIVDPDGQLVYPDPQHIPDVDYLEDHGMADYYHTGTVAPRAGTRPLIVRAIAVTGDDIVVSNEMATRIRNANRRDGFLRSWHVGILLDEGR